VVLAERLVEELDIRRFRLQPVNTRRSWVRVALGREAVARVVKVDPEEGWVAMVECP